MIPAAILTGRLYKRAESLEIRILELMPDAFTFRLPCDYLQDVTEVKGIDLTFFQYENMDYKDLILRDYRIEEYKATNYWKEYRIKCKDQDYIRASRQLSQEYLHYIDRKLSMDDVELASSMTTYPAQEIISPESDLQKKGWSLELQKAFAQKRLHREAFFGKEIMEKKCYLSLDNPWTTDTFLHGGITKCYEDILEKYDLIWHPLAKIHPSGIQIGNAFCQHLLPELSVLKDLFHRCCENNLMIRMVFPPIAESFWESCLTYIDAIHDFLGEEEIYCSGSERRMIMEVNDLGLMQELKNKDYPLFQIVAGLHFHKKTKDAREIYRKDYSRREAGICPSYDLADDAIYFPFYQTNTGTFCNLYAMIMYNDRSRQQRVIHCDKYCMNHTFLYPDHLHALWKYNSIFAWQAEDFLKEDLLMALWKEKESIILNF